MGSRPVPPALSACFNGAPRLGLGEGHADPARVGAVALASMGLRDWVSEKAATPNRCKRSASGFNGAPRLGLGEGTPNRRPMSRTSWELQWGSETGSRRRRAPVALRRTHARLQWGSETGSRRRTAPVRMPITVSVLLQWGSETGSRRREASCPTPISTPELQWGSETGSRRREEGQHIAGGVLNASMGLRDWVSEKELLQAQAGKLYRQLQWGSETGSRRRDTTPNRAATPASRFNGAPRLGLGEGRPTRLPVA